ncbi:GAF and ANTAR domain-containing protein [Jatrophihabitans telluris]|uniref:GAF and ANTAR domain-containing protein n=1 Tax=Jatrophihabitans telluris TaxID=2038343 RepID=A0ABY4QV46_9ACTN|nr:GAF and ANTAR domain-containing protein [Jatrophihabitans telluris]UQX87340.1 GAF and ANTAR domain-containing protein [Jatrophihabitans telluris]
MSTDSAEIVELSREFGELGRELRGPGDNTAALTRMVELAVKHIAPVSFASITMLRGNTGFTLASSDPTASRADALQYELGEGPCLESAEDDTNILLFDVASERRWPRFTQALTEQTPIRSVLAFQLVAQESAALNLFAEQPAAFGEDDIDMGTIFAAHTTGLVALHEVQDKNTNLQTALDTNREIGAAVGILMAYRRTSRDEAFTMLRTASQNLHRKLRDVAADVVETGALPGE